jgi:hypothetical protein
MWSQQSNMHADNQDEHDAHACSPSLKEMDLKTRACLAWADTLLKCLASPVVCASLSDVEGDGEVPVATGVRESVLLHVVTSFSPGSHSRVALQPGTAAEEANVSLGSTGVRCWVHARIQG